jgi:hypothetical protein
VPTVDFKSVQCKVRWQAAKLERTGHVRCATGLSGAPTSQRAPTVNRSKTQRCADVARTGQWTVPCPVHHRTVRCAHRQQKQPTARKWLEAINTPQPPPSMASKFSELHIHCKSKKISLQDTFQRSNPLQVSKSTQSLSDLRESVLCSFVAWIAFSFSFLFL